MVAISLAVCTFRGHNSTCTSSGNSHKLPCLRAGTGEGVQTMLSRPDSHSSCLTPACR